MEKNGEKVDGLQSGNYGKSRTIPRTKNGSKMQNVQYALTGLRRLLMHRDHRDVGQQNSLMILQTRK